VSFKCISTVAHAQGMTDQAIGRTSVFVITSCHAVRDSPSTTTVRFGGSGHIIPSSPRLEHRDDARLVSADANAVVDVSRTD